MTSQLYNTSMYSESFHDIIPDDFILIQDINDERFGFISLVKSKSTSRLLFVKTRYEHNSSYKLTFDVSQSLAALDTNFLMVYDIKPDPRTTTLKIYFEHFDADLAQLIRLQKKQNKPFTEEELYAILLGPLGGLACLERNGRSHDFIAPMSIFRVDAETYKISDNFILSEPKSLYQQVLKGHSSRYLAPELVPDERITPCEYDIAKADVFSLGICILDAGLLGIKGTFIHPQYKRFDEALLGKAINKFGEYYSPALTSILREMLCVNVTRRPNASSLLARISSQSFAETPVRNRMNETSIYKVMGNFTQIYPENNSMYSERFQTPSKEVFYSTFPGTPYYDTIREEDRTYELPKNGASLTQIPCRIAESREFSEGLLFAKPDQMMSDCFSNSLGSTHKSSLRKSPNSQSAFRNTFQSSGPLAYEVLSQSEYSRAGFEPEQSERLPNFFGDKDRLRIYHLEEIKDNSRAELPSKPSFDNINSYRNTSSLEAEQKNTALNRIIQESLDRTRTNIKMVKRDILGADESNLTFSILE